MNESNHTQRPLCACGCGERVKTVGSTTLRGHHMKLKKPDSIPEDRGYETPCLIWQGTISPVGYGRYEDSTSNTVLVHRQVWTAAYGDPGTLDVHHLCEQRNCVRLDHLELRSRSEHTRGHRGVSPEKYAEIIAALRTAQESQAGIARRFGVSKVFIWRLKKELALAGQSRHE